MPVPAPLGTTAAAHPQVAAETDPLFSADDAHCPSGAHRRASISVGDVEEITRRREHQSPTAFWPNRQPALPAGDRARFTAGPVVGGVRRTHSRDGPPGLPPWGSFRRSPFREDDPHAQHDSAAAHPHHPAPHRRR